jgi:hypothetical protein
MFREFHPPSPSVDSCNSNLKVMNPSERYCYFKHTGFDSLGGASGSLVQMSAAAAHTPLLN